MKTIPKFLIACLFLAFLLACASSGQKIKTQDNAPSSFVPFEEAPKIVKEVTPYYPLEAQERGITGEVWLKVLVDTLGKVGNPMIISGKGYNTEYFEKSAIEAALKTKWKPAKSDGKPISVWVTYKIDFKYR
jgi:protein TonB